MRNYMPKNKNPYQLPHNLYMQVLYIIKDYAAKEEVTLTLGRKEQWLAVGAACTTLREEYKKRTANLGELKPLRAFFEYPYYSMMFASSGKDMGAGRRSWNLYRCRMAYLVACALKLC